MGDQLEEEVETEADDVDNGVFWFKLDKVSVVRDGVVGTLDLEFVSYYSICKHSIYDNFDGKIC